MYNMHYTYDVQRKAAEVGRGRVRSKAAEVGRGKGKNKAADVGKGRVGVRQLMY